MKNTEKKHFLTLDILGCISLLVVLLSVLFWTLQNNSVQPEDDFPLTVSQLMEQVSISAFFIDNEETEEQKDLIDEAVNGFESIDSSKISFKKLNTKDFYPDKRQINLIFFNLPPPNLNS